MFSSLWFTCDWARRWFGAQLQIIDGRRGRKCLQITQVYQQQVLLALIHTLAFTHTAFLSPALQFTTSPFCFHFNIHAIFVRPHEDVRRTQVRLLCSSRCSRNVFTSCPSCSSDCCPVVIQGGFGFYAF